MCIAYVLGIATALLVGTVVGVVRANRMVNRHEKTFNDMTKNMNSLHDSFRKELDAFKREVYEDLDKSTGELNSYVDSRLDKLQSKLKITKIND